MKIRIILLAAAALAACCACSAGTDSHDSEIEISDSMYNEFSSRNPITGVSGYSAKPESPYLSYLGINDIRGTDAAELYEKTYAENTDDELFQVELTTENGFSDRLYELISADLSPDICEKTDDAFPYLSSRNMYEDLTAYIDISAPQWHDYASYIAAFEQKGLRFFYPTEVTALPQVLLYSRSRLAEAGLDNPEVLRKSGVWTRAAFGNILNVLPGISGEAVTENMLANYGVSLFMRGENSTVITMLSDDRFRAAAEFVNANYRKLVGSDEAAKAVEGLESGECAFVSVSVDTLAEIRKNYASDDLEIVPYPKEGTSDKYYTVSSGFLVPKRAKNIAGAAGFINCSRLAAEESLGGGLVTTLRRTELFLSDIETITAARGTGYSSVYFPFKCFDSDTNEASARLYEMILDGDISDWEAIEAEFAAQLEARD